MSETFDSIVNVGDYFSDHWLAEAFPGKLKALTKQWREREEHGKHSPLTGLTQAAHRYEQARADLPRRGSDSYLDSLTRLHQLILEALGYPAEPNGLEAELGGTALHVPLLARIQGPGGEALHVLQAHPVTEIDDLLADDAEVAEAAQLLHSETKHEAIKTVSKVVQSLMLCDQAPRYVLVLAGS